MPLNPVRNLLEGGRHIFTLGSGVSIAAILFTLETIGKEVVSFVNRIIDISHFHSSNCKLCIIFEGIVSSVELSVIAYANLATNKRTTTN